MFNFELPTKIRSERTNEPLGACKSWPSPSPIISQYDSEFPTFAACVKVCTELQPLKQVRRAMINSKSLDNLRPFKKGKSGNPGGLPKGTPKISTALVRFLAMPPRIFQNYKPRSVAEELAKNLIEIALCDNPSAALRATIVIFDRVEGKPAKSIYLHHGNGEITIEYENGWQPPQVEIERGDVWDDQRGVLYPAGSVDEEKTA